MIREATCSCGGRLCDMGYRGEFLKYAENNRDAWTTAGVKTVVTACSDGYHAFKRLYPAELDFNFEVLHITQFLDRLIREHFPGSAVLGVRSLVCATGGGILFGSLGARLAVRSRHDERIVQGVQTV